MTPGVRFAAVFCAAMLYWQAVAAGSGVAESWDAPRFWSLWYPLGLLFAAGSGAFVRQRTWLAGVVFMLPQTPLFIWPGLFGPFWAVGLLTLFLLSIPAAIVGGAAGMLARRWRGP